MQAATILAALQKAAQAPRIAGIHIRAVEIAAVRDWLHDPVMRITWTMPDASSVIESPAQSLPGVQASTLSRPSDTCMLLARDLASPDELELATLDAAWSLGAWDLSRVEHAPLPTDANWHEPRYGLMVDFGRNPYTICGQRLATGESANDDVCEIAAVNGWVTWTFSPAALAAPSTRAKYVLQDATLLPNGARPGSPKTPQQRWQHPDEPHIGHQHIYELGRSPDDITTRSSSTARGGKTSYANRLARRAIARAEKNKE